MTTKKTEKGAWYWMTLSKPSLYPIAKSIGGEAKAQAKQASNDWASTAFGVWIVILFFIVLGVLALFVG